MILNKIISSLKFRDRIKTDYAYCCIAVPRNTLIITVLYAMPNVLVALLESMSAYISI